MENIGHRLLSISTDSLAAVVPEGIRQLFEAPLVALIEQHGKLMHIPAGTVVLDAGQEVRAIPIVVKGSLKVSRIEEDGRELLLYYVSGGEGCAMTFNCCMHQFSSEVRAVAEDDTELIAIPAHFMDEWMMKFSGWKNFVMSTVRARFHELLRTIDLIAFQKLDDRLAAYLKDISVKSGSRLINHSHQQIADDLATSRAVISRLLKKLENDKKVLLFRNQIKIIGEL